jgi:hypothetical protein
MLRQDQRFGERAAFRWADWTMVVLVFLIALAAGAIGFLIPYLGS